MGRYYIWEAYWDGKSFLLSQFILLPVSVLIWMTDWWPLMTNDGYSSVKQFSSFFSAIIAVDEVIRQPRTLTDSIARLGNLQLRPVTQHIEQPRLVHPSRRQKLYGESSSILRVFFLLPSFDNRKLPNRKETIFHSAFRRPLHQRHLTLYSGIPWFRLPPSHISPMRLLLSEGENRKYWTR